MVISLDPSMFKEQERELLKSPDFSVSLFRYRSGVEAARIKAGRGEFVWLPYLGQQIWDWSVDGKSQKFDGFVKEPAYGRNFLQNYGGFLIHCGMTAMGNPGEGDTHPQHGEIPVARFDEAWIEVTEENGALRLKGRLHWHVPFVSEYSCVAGLRILAHGLSMDAELLLENPTAQAMEYMYLAHVNFPFKGAERILSTTTFDQTHVRIRNEPMPGLSAQPEAIKLIGQADPYDPELVAIVNDMDALGGNIGSALVCTDGTIRWVCQEGPSLDHHVVWITHNEDRGACGFHLPSTGGPDGYRSEKARGTVKQLSARGSVTMKYSCGYGDSRAALPFVCTT
ncbi:MAG: DUF4432 family protein [Spirochaetota bacterium]